MVVVLIGVTSLLAVQFARKLDDPKFLPYVDYLEYYAAGQLNVRGQDPYFEPDMLEIQQAVGGPAIERAVMMWNPPWTLSLAMPLTLVSPRLGQLLWLVMSFILVAWCADRLWLEYGGPREKRALAWGISFIFPPTLFLLQTGQIGAYLLLGATGFLLLVRRERFFAAGAVAALMGIKPHLMYLFWPTLAVWVAGSIRSTRWRVIAGGGIAAIVLSIAPLAFNRQVFGHYHTAMTERPPEQWKSPTPGMLLRELFGEENFRLQFVPPLIGLIWLVGWLYFTRKRTWDWAEVLPIVLLASIVSAPYGAWPFDLVILLPAVMLVAARTARANQRTTNRFALVGFAVIVGASLVTNLMRVNYEYYVWLAPLILLLFLVGRHLLANSPGQTLVAKS